MTPQSRKGDRHKDALIIVRVPPDMSEALLRIAEREDRPIAWVAHKAFAAYIAEQEMP